jgi:hypothetical protein
MYYNRRLRTGEWAKAGRAAAAVEGQLEEPGSSNIRWISRPARAAAAGEGADHHHQQQQQQQPAGDQTSSQGESWTARSRFPKFGRPILKKIMTGG